MDKPTESAAPQLRLAASEQGIDIHLALATEVDFEIAVAALNSVFKRLFPEKFALPEQGDAAPEEVESEPSTES